MKIKLIINLNIFYQAERLVGVVPATDRLVSRDQTALALELHTLIDQVALPPFSPAAATSRDGFETKPENDKCKISIVL